MDFAFGEEQELLRATTRRFLAEHQSRADVRRVMEDADPFDRRAVAAGGRAGLDRHAGTRGVRRRQRHRTADGRPGGTRRGARPGAQPRALRPDERRGGGDRQVREPDTAGHLPSRVGPRGCDRRLVPERRRVARAGRHRRAGDPPRTERGDSREFRGTCTEAGQASFLLVVASAARRLRQSPGPPRGPRTQCTNPVRPRPHPALLRADV